VENFHGKFRILEITTDFALHGDEDAFLAMTAVEV
jgi:hypothetical protein